MKIACLLRLAPVAALLAAGPALADSHIPAKILFSQVDGPAVMEARAVGYYTRGCVAGGKELAIDGPEWQAMRLSRNRIWGMPVLIDVIEREIADRPIGSDLEYFETLGGK